MRDWRIEAKRSARDQYFRRSKSIQDRLAHLVDEMETMQRQVVELIRRDSPRLPFAPRSQPAGPDRKSA